jgi:hypothetical protein
MQIDVDPSVFAIRARAEVKLQPSGGQSLRLPHTTSMLTPQPQFEK